MSDPGSPSTIAAFTMYSRPELVDSHDRYWALIRARLLASGFDAPERLSQDAEEFEVWNDPGLVLSQTCGMPYRLWLHGRVALVGTPDYGLEGCPAGYYRSAFVVRGDDARTELAEFKDSVFAYNQTFSQSGYAAPFAQALPHGFWFENRLHTEQHLESARAVSEGRADIASLDGVSWRLIQAYEPFAEKLRVLSWTVPTPGLPYITADQSKVAAIFDAVSGAIDSLVDADRKSLGLGGIVRIPEEEYLAVQNPPASFQ